MTWELDPPLKDDEKLVCKYCGVDLHDPYSRPHIDHLRCPKCNSKDTEVRVKKEPYKKTVTYRFQPTPDSDWFEITHFTFSEVEVEEVRKNGQEDTHMSGLFIRGEDGFECDLEESDTLVGQGGYATVLDIIEYLNTHGLPVS